MIRNDDGVRLDWMTEVDVASRLVVDVPAVRLQEANHLLRSQCAAPASSRVAGLRVVLRFFLGIVSCRGSTIT